MSYASRTGTRRNLRVMRAAGWRILVSARGVLRHEGFPYALDNGAWTSFQKGEPFDGDAFERALDWGGDGADWIVVPDVVGDRVASLRMTEHWLPRLNSYRLPLIAVQDGMTEADVAPWLSRCGLFLGGSTEWKEATMVEWGRVAKRHGCYFHVARVNSKRRISLAHEAMADSIDGTSVSRFACTIGKLDNAVRQTSIWGLAS